MIIGSLEAEWVVSHATIVDTDPHDKRIVGQWLQLGGRLIATHDPSKPTHNNIEQASDTFFIGDAAKGYYFLIIT